TKSRAIRVYWMLEELGLKAGPDYTFDPAGPQSEGVRAVSPGGKIPVLVVEEEGTRHVLPDSVAIVQFLADRHGDITHPAGTVARGEQDSFTQFAVDEVEGALWTASKHSFIYPSEMRVDAIKSVCAAEFDRAMKTLEARLGDRTYVTGERFTVPDLLLGHCAGWAKLVGFELPEGTVGAYFSRVRARPAFKAAIAATG
ncbi:MAG: glutathione S-transferase family protein, partial [Pseudomonadota bacterium]